MIGFTDGEGYRIVGRGEWLYRGFTVCVYIYRYIEIWLKVWVLIFPRDGIKQGFYQKLTFFALLCWDCFRRGGE